MKTPATILAALLAIPVTVYGDWLFEPSLTYSAYQYNPDGGTKADGNLGLLNLEFETEDRMGNFHRLRVSRSLHDDVSNMDMTLQQAIYRIGKYHYPKAEPTDLSIWTGVGYWEMQWADTSSAEGKDKYIYLPFGWEYAMPLDNRGSWPTGFAAQRNHVHFLVVGMEANLLVHGEGKNNSWRESSGYGYRLWLGHDYRMQSGRVLTNTIDYQAWDISDIGKTAVLNYTLGLRFQ